MPGKGTTNAMFSGTTRNYQRGMAIKVKKTFFRHSIFAKLKISFFCSLSKKKFDFVSEFAIFS